MKRLLPAGLAMIVLATPATAHNDDADFVMAAAARALPAEMLVDATVIATDPDGTMTQIQDGDGIYDCRVDALSRGEAKDMLNVFCLPKAFQPMLARMDAFAAEGVDADAANAALIAEAEAGDLDIPTDPMVGYAFRSEPGGYDGDPATVDGRSWQLILAPFATAESLGIPDRPNGSMPWVMAGGSPFAHIMVFGSENDD